MINLNAAITPSSSNEHPRLGSPPLVGGPKPHLRFRGGVTASAIVARGDYSAPNCITNQIQIRPNLTIDEPHDADTVVRQPGIAGCVSDNSSVLAMLPAIDFDSELGFRTKEIDDIRAKRSLAAESQTHKTVISQLAPKHEFFGGHPTSHDLAKSTVGLFDLLVRHRALPLPETAVAVSALPQGEGCSPNLRQDPFVGNPQPLSGGKATA